jgi:hypothetical protein
MKKALMLSFLVNRLINRITVSQLLPVTMFRVSIFDEAPFLAA